MAPGHARSGARGRAVLTSGRHTDHVDLALHLSQFDHPSDPAALAPALAAVARAADEGGFSTITAMDHFFQMESPGRSAEQPMLEGYTLLAFLAAHTQRVRLGLLVTGVTYRHPGILAKTVATLDVLSGGRAMLGIGAAWYEREHLALGVPYPPVAERFERLEETLRVCRQMWGDDDGPFAGQHYRLAETLCHPAPLQGQGLPVLIGGSGERKTLRLVARYADACNLFDVGAEGLSHKIDVLHRHCEDVGRDPGEIAITVIGGDDVLADTDAFVAKARDYARLGVGTIWTGFPVLDPALVARAGAEVVPRLAEL